MLTSVSSVAGRRFETRLREPSLHYSKMLTSRKTCITLDALNNCIWNTRDLHLQEVRLLVYPDHWVNKGYHCYIVRSIVDFPYITRKTYSIMASFIATFYIRIRQLSALSYRFRFVIYVYSMSSLLYSIYKFFFHRMFLGINNSA